MCGRTTRFRASSPVIGIQAIDGIPAIDGAVTFDAATGRYCVLLLNRDLARPREATLVFRDNAPPARYDSFADPGKVKPADIESGKSGGVDIAPNTLEAESNPKSGAAPQYSFGSEVCTAF